MNNNIFTISDFRNRIMAHRGTIDTDEVVRIASQNRFVKKHKLTFMIDVYIDDEIINNELNENTFVSLNGIAEKGIKTLIDVDVLEQEPDPNIKDLPHYDAKVVFRDNKIFIVKDEPWIPIEDIKEATKNDKSS